MICSLRRLQDVAMRELTPSFPPPASLPPVNQAQAVGVGERFGAVVAPEFRSRPIGRSTSPGLTH